MLVQISRSIGFLSGIFVFFRLVFLWGEEDGNAWDKIAPWAGYVYIRVWWRCSNYCHDFFAAGRQGL